MKTVFLLLDKLPNQSQRTQSAPLFYPDDRTNGYIPFLKALVLSEMQSCPRFGLVSLFNDIPTFVGYLKPKQFLQKNSNSR